MLLGDQIARLEDETVAAEMLIGLGDLTLTAQVTEAAAREGVTPGAFIAACVGRFVQGAGDEEWLTLAGSMSRAENPGQIFLVRVLHAVLPKIEAALDHVVASPDGRTADMGGRLGTKAFGERMAAAVGEGG